MGGRPTGDVLEREEMKPVALKRKAIADGDKVRYRVYRSPDDFVAVIAENALMAMKLTKINNPHRIIRDLPFANVAVEKEALVTHHMQPTVFIRPDLPVDDFKKTTHFEAAPVVDEEFVPLEVQALHPLTGRRDQLIDAETLLNSLKVPEPEAATATVVPPKSAAEPVPEPAPVMAAPPQEQVADELPPAEAAPGVVASPEAAPAADEVLSEEDVQRLLSQ